MKKLFFIIILFVFVLNKSALCNTSGSELLIYCTQAISIIDNKLQPDTEEIKNMSLCLGIIEGVYSSIIGFHDHLQIGIKICLPNNKVKFHQLARIFVKYANENPKYLNENGPGLFYKSMANSFPCSTTQKQPSGGVK